MPRRPWWSQIRSGFYNFLVSAGLHGTLSFLVEGTYVHTYEHSLLLPAVLSRSSSESITGQMVREQQEVQQLDEIHSNMSTDK